MDRIRVNIRINGIVQGIGFRPFLHRRMVEYGLSGWIRNTSEGVEIEAEGPEGNADGFLRELESSAPALASIENISIEKSAELKGHCGISILPSHAMARRSTLISPDVATCPDCLKELFDPADRRHRYPFINCTNCGPRFTIIRDLPYDRCSTTMAPFAMCPDCAAEYENIADRRYHAQPDCCPACGPELYFLDGDGRRLQGDPLSLAAKYLRDGKIIAVKGLGGMHLACRFDDPAIVDRLRRRKMRDEKPLAIMCRDLDIVRRFCALSPEEEAVLGSYARPIVLLRKKNSAALRQLSENKYLGVMLPYTPVHHLLLSAGPDCLVMTSANISELPIITSNAGALEKLRGVADGFLLNNREIENRCDDSLLYVLDGKPYFLRRSRGYVPHPLKLRGARGCFLACGAEQKASFCLSRNEQLFQGAHTGDLKNAETFDHYEKQIALFEHLFDIRPERIACDLHPDYLSTDYAQRRAKAENIPLLPVQHHHAHMAACMADNELEGECIGVIWDGTGFGSDGSAWGGEFFTGGYSGFSRAGTMRPIRLPGGDRAIKEIWRIGASLMRDAGLDPREIFPESGKICAMLDAGLNCPASHGMGRLFDGVCAIAGIRSAAGYEGQGAVLLEAAAEEDCREIYPHEIPIENGMFILDHRSMTAGICRDVREAVPAGRVAARFMNTLVRAAQDICARIRRDTGLGRVVLSGGVFQNMYLLDRLTAALEGDGFAVFRHCRVSTNDEGISFGQLAILERGSGTNVPCSTAEDC